MKATKRLGITNCWWQAQREMVAGGHDKAWQFARYCHLARQYGYLAATS